MRIVSALFFSCALIASVVASQSEQADIGLKRIVKRCPVCAGEGKRVFSPPDLGQHAGSGMSPHHWDVTSTCPVCSGMGRYKVYETFRRVPNPPEGVRACPTCGWSGCRPCRKCKGTGFLKCRNRGCEKGWIITQSNQLMSGKRKRPPTVTVCPECRGFAKVPCADCAGLGGEPCRKCNGDGRDLRERK